MLARMRSGFGGMAAIAMMVLAIWMWTRSADLSALLAPGPEHPQYELWAVRCCALAAAMGTQWLLLTVVVSAFYEERAIDEFMRMAAGLVGSLAMVAALALAVAGR